MKKPDTCPKCESHNVKRIMYGHPASPDNTHDDQVLGGCEVMDEEWHCGDCHWEWGRVGVGHYTETEE